MFKNNTKYQLSHQKIPICIISNSTATEFLFTHPYYD